MSAKVLKKMKLLAALSAIMSAVITGGNLITPVDPHSIPENNGNSGCYPYKEEKCCMKEWICKCHTGVFYEYNGIAACQPPGAILGPDAQSIPGYCC